MRLTGYGSELIIEGRYDFHVQQLGFKAIQDSYDLKIWFPQNYPKQIPAVMETKGRIPRTMDFHHFDNETFCLGSQIRLKELLLNTPNIADFAEKVLSPFLYAISYKIKYGKYPYGELAHGEAGLIDDYEQLFKVTGKASVLSVLSSLGQRKRDANKQPCPCGCGKRLGKCDFRYSLDKWRSLDKRSWYMNHVSEVFSPLEKDKPIKRIAP